MAENPNQSDQQEDQANPDWFREPSRREHFIGFALFVGFGIFFVMLFLFLHGWWFRWVVLLLALFSIWNGLTHIRNAMRRSSHG